MKNLFKVITAFCFLISINYVNAQNFEGLATYKSKAKMSDVKLDSTKFSNPNIQKEIMKLLVERSAKTYQLAFNNNTTIYNEMVEKSLDRPSPENMKSGLTVYSSSDNQVIYRDLKDSSYTWQRYIFDKQFLIKDKLKVLDWKLEDGTKNIGEYVCYKATLKKKVQISSEDGKDVLERTLNITAWYTLQIPINSGPEDYYGLPGLILEVNDGNKTIVCSEITINPKEKIEFKEPNKGKKINQTKFDKLQMEKIRERLQEGPKIKRHVIRG